MLRGARRSRRPRSPPSWRSPNTTEEGRGAAFSCGRPTTAKPSERATELGAELLGFYHSHPDHPARPSQYDLDHAWPTFALHHRRGRRRSAADMTVWYLKDDRSSFEEGSLQYGENSHPDTAQAVHG